jgi:hypothetical protein
MGKGAPAASAIPVEFARKDSGPQASLTQQYTLEFVQNP